MSRWLDIRVKTEQRHIDSVVSTIESLPDEIFVKYYYQKLRGIAARGARTIRHIIDTDTNTKNFEERGKVGRNGATGRMRDGVGWEVKKIGQHHYTFRVGWLDGTPGYAIFQEQGTKRGVQAMNAIAQAQEQMLSEIRQLTSGGKLNASPTGFFESIDDEEDY